MVYWFSNRKRNIKIKEIEKKRSYSYIYIYFFLFSIGHTFTRGLQKMKTTYENCQGRKKTSTKR